MLVPVNFSHRTLQRGVARPAAMFQHPIVPRLLAPTRVPVGTTIDFAQINRALVANQPPPIPAQFGDLHAVVQDQWVGPRQLALPADAPPFGLWLRTVETPQVDGASWYLSILAAVPTVGNRWPSAEKRQYADVVAVSYGTDPLLLGGIRVFHSGRRYGVEYAARNPDTGAFDRRRATVVDGPARFDTTHDVRLVRGLAKYANVLHERLNMATVLAQMHQDFSPETTLTGQAVQRTFDLTGFPLVADTVILSQTPARRNRLMRRDPHALFVGQRLLTPFLRTPHLNAGESAFLDDRLDELESGYLAHVRTLCDEQGAPVAMVDVHDRLATEPDAHRRAAFYNHMLLSFEEHHRRPGQLFETVGILNELVMGTDDDDFAERQLNSRFGMSPDQFFDLAKYYLDATAEEGSAFVALLATEQRRLVAGAGQMVMLHDVPFLVRSWIDHHGGPAPLLLGFSQVLGVLQQFFADMGFDVHRPPWNDVSIDGGRRTGKWQGVPTALPLNRLRSFITFQPPDVGYDLEMLKIVIHEFTHAMHFQTAQTRVRGFMAIKEASAVPGDWTEGVAVLVEQLWNHPAIVARYLANGAGLTGAYCTAWGTIQRLYQVWQTRKDFLIALQEIMLYREERPGSDDSLPFEDRLRLWHEWVPRYLFVATDPSVAVGEWALKPHLASKDFLLTYAQYPIGVVRTQPLFDRHIRRGTKRELQRLGADLRRLFRKGSMVTPADLESMGLRLPVT